MPVTTVPHPSTSISSATPLPIQPIFFWKPNDANGYLSQWYQSKFTVDNETYAQAEMWMMVQKARCFHDEAIAKQMLSTLNPKEHKALGRRVRRFDDRVWDERKLEIVTQGTYYKFTVSEDAENLFAERDALGNRQRWGQNLLGRG